MAQFSEQLADLSERTRCADGRVLNMHVVLVSVTPALGQYLMVIEACSKDVSNSCGPAQPSRGPLMECVKVHFQEFTEPCKAALVRIAVVGEPRGGESHEQ